MEWDGERFVDLISGQGADARAAEVQNGDGEVRDVDGDGMLELVLSHGAGHGPEADTAEPPRTEVWAWDGQAFSLACGEP